MLSKKIWIQRFKTEVKKEIPINREELRAMSHIYYKVDKRNITPREAADDCIYHTMLGIRLDAREHAYLVPPGYLVNQP